MRPTIRHCCLALAAALLLGACAPTVKVGCFEERDPMTGADFQWCGDDAIGGYGEPLRSDVDLLSLTPVKAELGGNTYYYMRMRYQGRGWLMLPPGSTITLNWEGRAEPLVLTTRMGSRPDSIRHIEGRYGSADRQAADYGTDAETILAIADQRWVTVTLKSGDRELESKLGQANLRPFRKFIAEYVVTN